jgi:DUF4097 and DUF4098 domain-containing protein YvlB
MRRHDIAPRLPLLWTALIACFLLLSVAAALRADADDRTASATRRQDFNASGALRSLTVENLFGSVEITAGPAFRATVDLTARASSEREARRILEETTSRLVNEDGALALVTEAPGSTARRIPGGGWKVRVRDADLGRVEARYVVTLPAGVPVSVSSVSGGVRVKGITADLKLSTVNGGIEVGGARGNLKLETVNGNIDASAAELAKDAEVALRSVSGNLVLRIPAAAGFRFEGRTMSGEILSTFPFPAMTPEPGSPHVATARVERGHAEASGQRVRERIRVESLGEDLSELNRSLAEMSREMARLSAEIAREVSINLNRSVGGTVAGGGAVVRMSNLSGRIVLLSEGSTEAQAKPLLGIRTPRIAEGVAPAALPALAGPPPSMPRLARAPAPPPPAAAPAPPEPPEFGRALVRGDLPGDFVATDVEGDVSLGRVSGKVKVSAGWGQIQVVSAGKGAELSTAGGNITLDAVTGDLVATTAGGDIRAGNVSGDARLETTGGDIVVKSGGGAVTARTTAGDITLRKIRGPVVAQTSGGSVLCEIVSVVRPGVEVTTGGGDVTLVLPANYRGDVDVRVTGVDSDEDYIVSQFPEVAVVKRETLQRAEGKLGGGGPRITVQTTAGVVRIRKGPPSP